MPYMQAPFLLNVIISIKPFVKGFSGDSQLFANTNRFECICRTQFVNGTFAYAENLCRFRNRITPFFRIGIWNSVSMFSNNVLLSVWLERAYGFLHIYNLRFSASHCNKK